MVPFAVESSDAVKIPDQVTPPSFDPTVLNVPPVTVMSLLLNSVTAYVKVIVTTVVLVVSFRFAAVISIPLVAKSGLTVSTTATASTSVAPSLPVTSYDNEKVIF